MTGEPAAGATVDLRVPEPLDRYRNWAAWGRRIPVPARVGVGRP